LGDYVPATLEEKLEGSMRDVQFGRPRLGTTESMQFDTVFEGELSFEEVGRVCAETPVRRSEQYPRRRFLGAGADPDTVPFNPSGACTLDDTEIISKAEWTLYVARLVRGRVRGTWQRRVRIAADGQLLEGQSGRFVVGAGSVATR
jgi:dihydroorotase-like cyclic amidohydrolase